MGLFDLFRRRKRELGIGIDIGSSALKIAITTPVKEGNYNLEEIICHPLPQGVVEKGNILNPEELVKHLKSIKGRLPEGIVSYAFSPYKTTLFSFKTIKEVKDSDIEKMVYKELSHRIPLPLSELSVDYDYSTLDDGTKVVTVIVGKRKHIEETVNLLEDAGIQIDSITSTYASIANTSMLVFSELSEEKCGMVVDIGYSMCCCVCINKGIATHGGCIEKGVNVIEEEIQAITSASPQETRRRIIKGEISQEMADAAAFRFIDGVIGEIDAYSTLCQSDTPLSCEGFELILCGGGAGIMEMCNRIKLHLSHIYQVKLLDPLGGLQMKPDTMEKMERLGSTRFVVAIGASLI